MGTPGERIISQTRQLKIYFEYTGLFNEPFISISRFHFAEISEGAEVCDATKA